MAAEGETEGTATSAGYDAPTDEAILTHENEVRNAALAGRTLGEREGLEALQAEYAAGSAVFVEKIEQLAAAYAAVRRARGDGNCFFRGFLFAWLENLSSRPAEEQAAAKATLVGLTAKLVAAGFQELVFEDALEVLVELVDSVSAPEPISVEELFFRLSDEHVSNYCIMLLRMITSCELQRRADHFTPFLFSMSDEIVSIEQFCRKHVEAMGEESDHIHIVAITDALQAPIRVVYLDNAVGGDGKAVLNHHDFTPEGVADPTPRFAMLYRPGHYDVLYAA